MAAVTLLSTKGLSRHFGGLRAVDSVDFALGEGEVRALIGPNGAGKSTFVGLICGRIPPTAGRVIFEGRDISDLPAHRRVGLGIAYTFQITSIYGSLSVFNNVALAAQSSMRREGGVGPLGDGVSRSPAAPTLDDETERRHSVPSPLVGEGQGGGESQASKGGLPPTPNPSPRRAEGAPSARRGGESAQRLFHFRPLASIGSGLRRGIRAGGLSPASELDRRVGDALGRVGLADHRDAKASTLPYGHQRLLEVAMGLALAPKLLILDEPTQGLSDAEIAGFCDLTRAIAREVTVLLIEHNMDVVMELAGRVTVMNNGAILSEGTPAEVRADPAVQRAYLGT